jgi:ABC-type xylose transport system permease subunit
MPALLKFNLRDAGTLIGLLIIVVTFSFLSPVFFTLPNLLNILQQSSIVTTIINNPIKVPASRRLNFSSAGMRTPAWGVV